MDYLKLGAKLANVAVKIVISANIFADGCIFLMIVNGLCWKIIIFVPYFIIM